MDSPCRCVTVLLPGGVSLTSGGLRTLLALLRRRSGGAPWSAVRADAYQCPGGTLLIVRERPVEAYLADYALPFLQKYFTQ